MLRIVHIITVNTEKGLSLDVSLLDTAVFSQAYYLITAFYKMFVERKVRMDTSAII